MWSEIKDISKWVHKWALEILPDIFTNWAHIPLYKYFDHFWILRYLQQKKKIYNPHLSLDSYLTTSTLRYGEFENMFDFTVILK